MSRDYWKEAISQSADENDIALTQEQISALAKDVEDAHEMYGEAHGHHHIPNPQTAEIKELAAALEAERRKRVCEECGGRGTVTSHGPAHSATSQCWKCRGEGKR